MIGQWVHLGIGGGVLACVVGFGYVGCAEGESGYESVDEGCLPYPAMSGEEGYLAVEEFTECVYPFVLLG